MNELPTGDAAAVLDRLRAQTRREEFRVTLHAQREMAGEEIALAEVIEAIEQGRIPEYYPTHQRGPCCLLYGASRAGRPLHVVCTTAHPLLIIITVYEPTPPKWTTPTTRRRTA